MFNKPIHTAHDAPDDLYIPVHIMPVEAFTERSAEINRLDLTLGRKGSVVNQRISC